MSPISSLPIADYLSKATENYVTVLDGLEPESCGGEIQALARFHYLKLNPITGEPMLQELVDVLYDQLAEYCLKASKLESATYSHQHNTIQREARALLRKHKTGGEAGEILAYFLIESVLGAPQLVAKMDLKTSTNVESLGVDGLHFKWSGTDNALDIYCAESKLEKEPSAAISNAVKSLVGFYHTKGYMNEIRLATAHFKHSDEEMKRQVINILQNRTPSVTYRFRHACLVGYNWKGYVGLAGVDVREREKEFRVRYAAERDRLHNLIRIHFPKAKEAAGTLIAFDVFFLPFQSVQQFRDAFNNAVR
jgi:hypothetical protein